MNLVKKYNQVFFILLIFLIIFIITSLQINIDPDTYFHLASGEVIAHHGIIHQEALSQAGANRQWIPAEWLFQLVFYWFTSLFGFASFRIFTGILSAVHVAALYLLLRRIVRVNVVFSLGLSLLYVLLVYFFLAPRPQVPAITILIAELYILLLYILKNKNILYLLLPLTYLWANFHASVILSLFLCFAYFVFCIVRSYINKKEEAVWLKKAKVLGLYTLGVGIVSVLPPQGLMPYQFMLLLFRYRVLSSVFVSEWLPLSSSWFEFTFYSCLVGITLIAFFFIMIKKKLLARAAWIFPLLLFIPFGYTAYRNVYYGYFTAIVLLGWLFSQLNFRHLSKALKILFCIVVFAVFGYGIWLRMEGLKFLINTIKYPNNAADFISEQNIQGNMFNQYTYGGYLEYRLYPAHKVFIDGREDPFLCCELPDYVTLEHKVALPAPKFSNLLTSFFEKYHTSYVVLSMDNEPLAQKLSDILVNDRQWSLVFWDDTNEIFVKDDGKNSNLLSGFGSNAVDPFGDVPIKKGLEQQAYYEYVRMVKIQDSAISRSQIGLGLEQQGKLDEAAKQLEKAIQLDKSYAPSYATLANVKANQRQFQSAIELYKQALSLDEHQLIIYLRLAQLYYALHDSQNARDILKQGASHAVYDSDRQMLLKILNQQTGSPETSTQPQPPSLPSGWKQFTNAAMNLAFIYPQTLRVNQIKPQIVALSDPTQTNFKNELLIYSGELQSDNSKNLWVPFHLLGQLQQTQPVQLPGFQAVLNTYSDTTIQTRLLLLKHGQQLIALYYPEKLSFNQEVLNQIIQSVATTQ